LPAGMGIGLRDDMKALIETLRQEIAQAFESEPYISSADKLRDEVEDAREELIRSLEAQARAQNFDIVRTASGMDLVPTRDGKALAEEDVKALPEAEQRELESTRRVLGREVDSGARTIRSQE